MIKCGTHMLVIIRMQKRSRSFPVIAPPLLLLALDVRQASLSLSCVFPCCNRETSLMSNLSPSRTEGGKRMTQTSVTCKLSNSCSTIVTGQNRKAYCFRQVVIYSQLWCSSTTIGSDSSRPSYVHSGIVMFRQGSPVVFKYTS